MDINFYNGKPFEYHGTHNGVDYWIVSRGYHPCAYVIYAQIESKTYLSEYECHGKVTYRGPIEFAEGDKYVIGWDYAHIGSNDYSTIYAEGYNLDVSKLKRWTFSEVEKEVFDFIDKYKLQEENGTTDISNREKGEEHD